MLLLILANLIPLGGLLFFEWTLFSVLFYYWLETIVVGLLIVPKMIMASGMDAQMKKSLEAIAEEKRAVAYRAIKIFTVPFFLFHFGIFVAVHGVFLFTLFGPADVSWRDALVACISFAASHGYSFVHNFIGREEYKTRSVNQQMGQPYKRVVIMHVVIIFGAMPLLAFRVVMWPVFLLIALKTIIDFVMHTREHAMQAKMNINI